MMELVDMRDLGSRAFRRWGSSPHARTMLSKHYRCRRRNAYGINRFRDFFSQNFTENSIDANGLFPPTGGTRTPSSLPLAQI